MLRFAHIEFLWALAFVPVMIVIFLRVTRWKKKAISKLGDRKVVDMLIPEVSFSRPWIKFILLVLSYVFLVVGIADPQMGSKTEEVKQKSADLMILLDVSNSMLAGDIVPNRLESAKRSIAQLIDNMHQDRLGIIVFAGEAYVQLPITTDHSAAKLFLNNISPDMVPTQGTAIGAAITLGMKSFDFKNGTGKAMIVITDGENHEDDAVAMAKQAADQDVMINVIGIGSPEGAPVPIVQDGKQVGFHTDSIGNNVITKLNEEMGKEIAAAGKGTYVRATNGNSGMNIVMEQVDRVQRKTVNSRNFKEFEHRFQLFLVLAVLLLIAEFFISNRKNIRFSNVNIFEVRSAGSYQSPTRMKKK